MSGLDEERMADLLARYDEDALAPEEEEELASELFADPALLGEAGGDRLVDRLLRHRALAGAESRAGLPPRPVPRRRRGPGGLLDLLVRRPAVPAIYAVAGAFAILWLISTRPPEHSTAAPAWTAKPGTRLTLFVPPSGAAWVESGVSIPPGARVRIEASGAVQGGGASGLVGPDGAEGGVPAGDRPVPSAPHLALVGVIGSVQPRAGKEAPDRPFRIGSRYSSEAAEVAGKLYLAVNDVFLWDNEGSFEAVIWIDGELKASVSVPGFAAAWMDTPLVLRRGQVVRVEAAGEIQIGGTAREVADPSGDGWPPSEDMSGYPLPGANRYSLIGVMSASEGGPGRSFRPGNAFYLGKAGEIEVKEPGRLFLGVNDHWPLDNTGSYSVTLTVVR